MQINNVVTERLVAIFCSITLLFLVYRSVLWQPTIPPPPPPEPCIGEPIYTQYAFESGNLEPHACKVQCGTKQQHYVVYTDGQATQCEKLPGCLDYGEDNGITCTIPSQ